MSAPAISLTHTYVELSDTNCVWCLAAALDHLRADQYVAAVHLNHSAGCLVVDHHANPERLVRRLAGDLRGWTRADNGEAVMVRCDAREEPRCCPSPKPRDR